MRAVCLGLRQRRSAVSSWRPPPVPSGIAVEQTPDRRQRGSYCELDRITRKHSKTSAARAREWASRDESVSRARGSHAVRDVSRCCRQFNRFAGQLLVRV